MAARPEETLPCPLGANLVLQLLATVYLALTLHATCRGEMGTSFDMLPTSSSREEERTVCMRFPLLAGGMYTKSCALSGFSSSTSSHLCYCPLPGL